jgi:hemolysin activation/secretion protein
MADAARILSRWLVVLSLGHSMQLHAQTPVDGGQLRQQIERELPPLQPQPKTAAPKPAPSAMTSLQGTVLVREFLFNGNTRISSADLEAAVESWRNQTLNFNQLQAAVAAAGQVYRNAGWVVRVYLPQQEIANGAVTIQVIEAVFGGVQVESDKATHIHPERAKKIVEAHQTLGAPLRADALDRSLLLLRELPGVSVAASLREGQNQAQSEVVLTTTDTALLAGDAAVDNTGLRATGAEHVAANLYLNSPLHITDQASLNAVHSKGSDFVRVAYAVPLGYEGWRFGINASHLRYELVSKEFRALDADGESDASGVELYYPIYRSRQANLSFVATLDYKTFDNTSGGEATTRYHMTTWSTGVTGSRYDLFGGGGTSSASMTVVGGNVDLDGSPNRTADALTTRTDGHFDKLVYAASRLQFITETVSFLAALRGQVAGQNLDSSEKFYLGGFSGVRAYPSSEGSGSEGEMVNLDLRWRARENWMLSSFYDWGRVTVNRDNDFTGSAERNRFSLKGAGLAVAWLGANDKSVQAMWARRIGSNPNATGDGKDQDGSLVRNRFWLTASLSF